jgi:hypothetical protein
MVRDQLEVELAALDDPKLVALAGEQHRTMLLGSPWTHEVP